jgi:hypothetical protein
LNKSQFKIHTSSVAGTWWHNVPFSFAKTNNNHTAKKKGKTKTKRPHTHAHDMQNHDKAKA